MGTLSRTWRIATAITFTALVGCFSERTKAFSDNDILQILNSNRPLVDAYVRRLDDNTLLSLHDPTVSRPFLHSLLPIKSARKATDDLDDADFELYYQIARNPLVVAIDVSDHTDQLIFQIDNYRYNGGSARLFFDALETVHPQESSEASRSQNH